MLLPLMRQTDSPSCSHDLEEALRPPLPLRPLHAVRSFAGPPTCALIPPRASTYPSVVMVTMVYQKEAGMLVNLLAEEPFSA